MEIKKTVKTGEEKNQWRRQHQNFEGRQRMAKTHFGGKNVNKKLLAKHAKTNHCYAEIVKFGLVLTHLKSFWGKSRGQENILESYPPPFPLWRRHWEKPEEGKTAQKL